MRMQSAAAATMPTTMPVVLLDSRITSTAPEQEREEKREGVSEGQGAGGRHRERNNSLTHPNRFQLALAETRAGWARPPAGRALRFKRAAAQMPWAPHARAL
uniref:Uncharacterized protein n=1 Tax=Piliocolobus tephrosceles TaxID=591936 RepID=A0A8C9HEL8_9PRIM